MPLTSKDIQCADIDRRMEREVPPAPFEALGIRWQVANGEPSHIGAEWTTSWAELLDEALAADWAILSIVFRTLAALRHEPAEHELVDEDLAAAVSSYWNGYLVQQMERAV